MKKPKLIRITTVDGTFEGQLKGQPGYIQSEFEVICIADDSGKLKLVAEREGVRAIAVTMSRKISLLGDLRSLCKLIHIFRIERPYIVHVNTPKASLLGLVAAWLTRVPHRIYTVTGLRFETTNGLFRFLLMTMERITCFLATKVIPEGDGVRNTLYQENITRKPLKKIHNGNINGIDVAYFDRTDELLNCAIKIRGGISDFIFIFIGRIVRDKGINELVMAFDRLSYKYKNVGLWLVGYFEDELDPILPITKHILNTNKHIHYFGFQSDIRPYLVGADVLILPSYREGFPNVVLQAGAMGLPCIVTDINGCNEIIIENHNGLIVPKQDEEALYTAMEYLVLHPDKVNFLAKSSRNLIVTRYQRSDVWQATLKMYKSLK